MLVDISDRSETEKTGCEHMFSAFPSSTKRTWRDLCWYCQRILAYLTDEVGSLGRDAGGADEREVAYQPERRDGN